MATSLSRAATVSAASGYHRRRGSFTADRTDSHTLSNHTFDKRVSRDDLALILKSSKKNNVTAFHIPIHGRLPSPEHSPRTSSVTRTTWVRSSTPDSMIDSSETGVIAVGMAIGSPTQMGDLAPAPWNPQNRAMNAVVDIPEPIPEPIPESVEDTQQKTRKWGLFRSKSKRTTRPEKPQRSMTESVNTSTTSLGSSGMPTSAPIEQSSRKMPKHKPIIIRSQTEPIISEPAEIVEEIPRSVPMSAEAKPTSPGKLTKENPALQRKASKEAKLKDSGSGGIGRKMSLRGLRGDSKRRSEKAVVPPPSSPPPMPAIPHNLLDVEIPSIKMDRYSVMFNSVLQPPPQAPASSLLARRQATLDHLQTVKDAITENREEALRPRRATSPQPSPTFAQPDTSKPLPSPRFRANTSPALLDSAYYERESFHEAATPRVAQILRSESQHDKFATQSPHYQPALVSKFNRRPSDASPGKVNVGSAKQISPPMPVISPDTYSKHSSPYTPSPGAIPESPEHTDDEKEVHVAKDRVISSSSQMVSPPASITSSSAENPRRFSPPSASLTSPSNQSSEADAQEALRNAVEISIARQISVSHQQRKMLHPLKSNPSLRHRSNGNGSPSGPGYIPIEKGERLAETRSSTPVLVHPRELTHSPDAYQMHRKSERVILEEP
ncbi:hypothetical protein F53441_6869 [Fusarium austroafricanum]|uniref:Uncharacterized protein n=1 Tax=Fusarium austroafricanum TaxID=2364996 RepID=A0A8H4KEQ8_9HYPO|nr:hypothetical protein F53441_6869 [Fusarium austroafricanum]